MLKSHKYFPVEWIRPDPHFIAGIFRGWKYLYQNQKLWCLLLCIIVVMIVIRMKWYDRPGILCWSDAIWYNLLLSSQFLKGGPFRGLWCVKGRKMRWVTTRIRREFPPDRGLNAAIIELMKWSHPVQWQFKFPQNCQYFLGFIRTALAPVFWPGICICSFQN